MPGGDGTGPGGMGPMTGRAAGYCAGYGVPGYANPVPGGGFGGGFGRGFRGGGRGWRNWYHATGLPGWQRARMGLPAYGPGGWGAAPAYAAGGAYASSYAAPSRAQETQALKGQAEYLQSALKDVQARLDELEKESSA